MGEVGWGQGWVGWGGNDIINIYTHGELVHNKSKLQILTSDDVPAISFGKK